MLFVNTKQFVLLICGEEAFLAAGLKLHGDNKLPAGLTGLNDITVTVVVMKDTLSAFPEQSLFIGRRYKTRCGSSGAFQKIAVNFRQKAARLHI